MYRHCSSTWLKRKKTRRRNGGKHGGGWGGGEWVELRLAGKSICKEGEVESDYGRMR